MARRLVPSPLVARDRSVTWRDVSVRGDVVPRRIFPCRGGRDDRLKCRYRLHVLPSPGDSLGRMSSLVTGLDTVLAMRPGRVGEACVGRRRAHQDAFIFF